MALSQQRSSCITSGQVSRKSWTEATTNAAIMHAKDDKQRHRVDAHKPRVNAQHSTHQHAATSRQRAATQNALKRDMATRSNITRRNVESARNSVRNDARFASGTHQTTRSNIAVASGTSMVAANKSSREKEVRYRYDTDESGFIELSHHITHAEFVHRLKNISGVKQVTEHKSNVWVLSSMSGEWIEFQMTHEARVTIMFREPPPHLFSEARRILRAAVEVSANDSIRRRLSSGSSSCSEQSRDSSESMHEDRSCKRRRSRSTLYSSDYTSTASTSDAHKENAASSTAVATPAQQDYSARGSSCSLVDSEDDASKPIHEQDQSADSFDESSDESSSTSSAAPVSGMVRVDLDADAEIDDFPDRSPSPDATRKRKRSVSPNYEPESKSSAAPGNATIDSALPQQTRMPSSASANDCERMPSYRRDTALSGRMM